MNGHAKIVVLDRTGRWKLKESLVETGDLERQLAVLRMKRWNVKWYVWQFGQWMEPVDSKRLDAA